ncbi:MAG: DUF4910 domain-containing protein [Rhodospirillum sp.]|nr:DUF4910 domain-containing protein [Rhodospirillum sp.]MCF8490777.1 DUF4910 domain-containing protein [Rhodospirillum sp.]
MNERVINYPLPPEGNALRLLGEEMHGWARALFHLPRSLTGPGVRATLAYIGDVLPGLSLFEVPTGTVALDWEVPDEWTLREAWIEDTEGRRLIDSRDRWLHVMGYSEAVDAVLSREELEPHLYVHPTLSNAIPYVTSYYQRRWGFCLSQGQKNTLGPGPFRVRIDSDLKPGGLSYAELILPGDSDREIFLTTYVCHPDMGNNELSGPVVATALARWLTTLPRRRYTYRFVFGPETLGAAVYLSRHMDHLKAKVDAGFVITCVGDDRAHGFLPSRLGKTLADRVGRQVLRHRAPDFTEYSFRTRGSDERMYCSPLVDLPVVSVMRSKYTTYPEYHSSLDDLSLITPSGLAGGFSALADCIATLEANERWLATVPGEPRLDPRGLKPTISHTAGHNLSHDLMDVYFHCDGRHDLLAIAERLDMPMGTVASLASELARHGLITPI